MKKNLIKILVVEDDPFQLEALMLRLTSDGYQCVGASTVDDGLVRLVATDEPIDFVVTDLHFGSRDPQGGFRIVAAAKTLTDRHVPVIIITGYGPVRTAVSVMHLGIADFVEKGDQDSGELLISKIAQALKERASILEQRRIQDEQAADLQRACTLLAQWNRCAPVVTSEWHAEGRWHPNESGGKGGLSGDVLWHAHREDTGAVTVAIADVKGHGAAAALLGVRFRSDIAAVLERDVHPLATVRNLRTRTSYLEPPEMATFAYVLLESAGRVSYCNAGHPDALLLRGSAVHALGQTGPLLVCGLADLPLDTVHDVTLDVADRLLLFSDGASDRLEEASAASGINALGELLQQTRGQDVAAALNTILDAVRRCSSEPLRDDVTLLLIERRDPSAAKG